MFGRTELALDGIPQASPPNDHIIEQYEFIPLISIVPRWRFLDPLYSWMWPKNRFWSIGGCGRVLQYSQELYVAYQATILECDWRQWGLSKSTTPEGQSWHKRPKKNLQNWTLQNFAIIVHFCSTVKSKVLIFFLVLEMPTTKKILKIFIILNMKNTSSVPD